MLQFGLYEQVITDYLKDELSKLNEDWHEAKIEKIDHAESAAILGKYMGRMLTEVMHYLDNSETAVRDRVALCNSIISFIIQYLDHHTDQLDDELVSRLKGQLIHQDAEMLLELLDKKAFSKPACALTPLCPSVLCSPGISGNQA